MRGLLVLLTALCCLVSLNARNDRPLHRDTIGEIVQLDFYDNAVGFYVYLPVERSDDSMSLVVFLHGYGALNPMIYGKWIEHIVSQGHCVIYPRYQMTLFQPSAQEFVPNTVEALHTFLRDAARDIPVRRNEMYLVGHSYGGVIGANLAARYVQYRLPRPRVAFICEPGTGPLSGGVLDSYETIDPDILLAVIVGDDDATVGQKFGVNLYESATKTPQRLLVWQYADMNGNERVSASHYEPYSIDERYDNDIRNMTVHKALRVGRLNQVDHHGYWKLFDTLMDMVRSAEVLLDEKTLDSLSDLGTWSDGTPVRRMDISHPVK